MQSIQTIPGYKINEYMLVLNPHEELRNKIIQTRKEFNETFQAQSLLGLKPNLGLVRFTQYAMMEERLINRLRVVAMGYHPFKVELKDFGSFPSHTIYINVTSKLPVQGLVREVRKEAQRLMKLNDENKPHFIMEPHITIVRKLKPWQYEKGWLEYSNSSFAGRFIANDMVLLRRPFGESRYQAVKKFSFENLPVTTKQGELFG